MFRPASRSLLRCAQSSLAPARTISGRRCISTAPPHLRSRSWKSSAARWGLAITGIYYYNTSPVFAEQPSNNLLNPSIEALEESEQSSLETLTSRRTRQNDKNASVLESAIQTTSSENASHTSLPESTDHNDSTSGSSPAELEQEAEVQGAFNEETGEINWDCPCLGGMAHGPCGPEFREAFSCFVFSKEEPKGMDCIDKFKGMQDCFQKYPEIYKGELEDDEELDPEAKAELEGEIAARREEIEQQRGGSKKPEPSERRLLEESGPSREKSTGTSSTQNAQSAAKAPSSARKPSTDARIPTAPSTPEPQIGARPPASPEPHSGMSEKRESADEGQSSPLVRTPNPPPVQKENFDEDLELMPKDWHDARNIDSSGKQTGK